MREQDAAGRVREAFVAAGFTAAGVRAALGEQAWSALSRDERAPLIRALGDPAHSPIASLVRMFVLGDAIEPHGDVPVEALVSLGLARVEGPRVVPSFDVRPYGQDDADWWVVSDFAHLARRPLTPDHVLGVGGASTTLAHLTPRAPVDAALDIGTGCGVQAMHLATHASTVIATDTNVRALHAAHLSAMLSGLVITTHQGSLLEPVAGESFDLIVSNPPFVVSDGRSFEYRDGGMTGDDLGRSLVRGIPGHLREGGRAVLLANWLHAHDEDWQERVAGWVQGLECDAWIVQRDVQDATQYVGSWMAEATVPGTDIYQAQALRWLEALDRLGAHAIGFGWIVLQRTGAVDPPVVIEDRTSAPRLPGGPQVLEALALHRLLAETDAFAMLAGRWAVAEGVVLQAEEHRAGGAWLPGPHRAVRSGDWRAPVELDHLGALLLRHCDGTRSLGEVVGRVEEQTGLPEDEVLASCLLTARVLLAEGLLVRGI